MRLIAGENEKGLGAASLAAPRPRNLLSWCSGVRIFKVRGRVPAASSPALHRQAILRVNAIKQPLCRWLKNRQGLRRRDQLTCAIGVRQSCRATGYGESLWIVPGG